MTQVGKILVLVIMAFSLIFLGISSMVFVTSKNWKTETTKKTEEVNKVKNDPDGRARQGRRGQEEPGRGRAHEQQATKALDGRIRTLEDQNKRDLADIAAVRGAARHGLADLEDIAGGRRVPAQRDRGCCGSRRRPWRSRPTSTSSARPS